jgi:ribosomal protein S14
MISSRVKDQKNRKLFAKMEQNRLLLKFIYINLISKVNLVKSRPYLQYKYYRHFNKLKFKISSKLLNKCIISNRNSKTYSGFKLSRIVFKDLLTFGVIAGYRKSVF